MEPRDWEHILRQLRVPFAADIVAWKPQTVSRDRKRCLAVPYAETQPYQERLDHVCPEWQDDYAIWFSDPQEMVGRGGEKKVISGKVFVKCRLTIAEHTRSDVGECELTDENALTTAKAQAFKRACAAFGLGRYLYDLPKAWVDFDDDKGIIEGELRKLEAGLRRYAGGNGNSGAQRSESPAGHSEPPTARPEAAGLRSEASGHATNGGTRAAMTHETAIRSVQAPAPSSPANAPASGSARRAEVSVRRVVGEQAAVAAAESRKAEPAADDAPAPAREPSPQPRSERQTRSRRSSQPAAERMPAPDQADGQSTETTAGGEGERPVQTNEAPDGGEQILCPLHHVPLQLVITREGKSVLLHKIEGEGYCNGEVVRAPARS